MSSYLSTGAEVRIHVAENLDFAINSGFGEGCLIIVLFIYTIR